MIIAMIRITTLLLTATFSLLSVLISHTGYAQAVPTAAAAPTSIKIWALPFTISAPGTYILTGNLTFNSFVDPAITITAGSVILDLKGYTMLNIYQAPPGSAGASAGVAITNSATTNNITIRNGTIKSFYNGVAIEGGPQSPIIVNLQINEMTFIGINFSKGVSFIRTNLSSISNCHFIQCGIMDSLSQGGNRYSDNSFIDGGISIDNCLRSERSNLHSFNFRELPCRATII
jgi:hypothetical protein